MLPYWHVHIHTCACVSPCFLFTKKNEIMSTTYPNSWKPSRSFGFHGHRVTLPHRGRRSPKPSLGERCLLETPRLRRCTIVRVPRLLFVLQELVSNELLRWMKFLQLDYSFIIDTDLQHTLFMKRLETLWNVYNNSQFDLHLTGVTSHCLHCTRTQFFVDITLSTFLYEINK